MITRAVKAGGFDTLRFARNISKTVRGPHAGRPWQPAGRTPGQGPAQAAAIRSASQRPISLISSMHIECGIGYSCHSTPMTATGQEIPGTDAQFRRHDIVFGTVGGENRQCRIGCRRFQFDQPGRRDVGRECDDAGQ